MSGANDNELAALFDRAERAGRCLVIREPRLRMAARRRMGEGGQILSPVRGLQELHGEWVFCGPSAALAYGADISWGLLEPIHLVARSGSWASSPGFARHSVRLDEGPWGRAVWRAGVLVTPLLRTVFDCLRWMDFREGMVVADWALRVCPGGREAIEKYLGDMRASCRGVGRALGVLASADGRAESGGESIARAVMIEQGYMLPQLQVEVPDPLHPGRRFRADFVWVRADGRVIVGECDGRRKIFDPVMNGGMTPEQALDAQRGREGLITAYDVSVLRFTYGEAAGVEGLVSKLELYGVPKLDSPLATAGEPVAIDWAALLRG